MYKIFIAIEPGTEFEEFVDHVCGTQYVADSDYAYGDDYGIPDSLFYVLRTKNYYDAGMIAKCIHVASRIGMKKGKLYRVSIGGRDTELDDFILRCMS